MIIEKAKYIASELYDNYDDSAWRRQRIHARINGPFQKYVYPRDRGTRLMEEDWDTAVILDGCRADLFEENVNLDKFDRYQSKVTATGATDRWLKTNFSGEYGDTVYVTGNPMVSRHTPGQFYRLIETWLEGFDPGLGAPSATDVTDAALTVHTEYPKKKVIVHYMQPHYPFVRDPQLRFTSFSGTDEWNATGDERAPDVWEALRDGIVSKNEVLAGYRRNLEYVMDAVERLLSKISGRVIVTADHGNLIGEWTYPIPIQEYGHPSSLKQHSLTTVPWAIKNGERREIRDDGITSHSRADRNTISDRLSDLGYLE